MIFFKERGEFFRRRGRVGLGLNDADGPAQFRFLRFLSGGQRDAQFFGFEVVEREEGIDADRYRLLGVADEAEHQRADVLNAELGGACDGFLADGLAADEDFGQDGLQRVDGRFGGAIREVLAQAGDTVALRRLGPIAEELEGRDDCAPFR